MRDRENKVPKKSDPEHEPTDGSYPPDITDNEELSRRVGTVLEGFAVALKSVEVATQRMADNLQSIRAELVVDDLYMISPYGPTTSSKALNDVQDALLRVVVSKAIQEGLVIDPYEMQGAARNMSVEFDAMRMEHRVTMTMRAYSHEI